MILSVLFCMKVLFVVVDVWIGLILNMNVLLVSGSIFWFMLNRNIRYKFIIFPHTVQEFTISESVLAFPMLLI